MNTDWNKLDKSTVAIGQFGEFYAKTFLASYGLDIYGSEVDDHGIDLIAKTKSGRYLEFQVKTIRGEKTGYIYMKQARFCKEQENLFLILQILWNGKVPALYIIPSAVWKTPNAVFASRDDYETPEYGINISKKNLPALETYQAENTIEELCR